MPGEVFKYGEQVDVTRFYLDQEYQDEVLRIIVEAGVSQAAVDEFVRRLNLATQGQNPGKANAEVSEQLRQVTQALYPTN